MFHICRILGYWFPMGTHHHWKGTKNSHSGGRKLGPGLGNRRIMPPHPPVPTHPRHSLIKAQTKGSGRLLYMTDGAILHKRPLSILQYDNNI